MRLTRFARTSVAFVAVLALFAISATAAVKLPVSVAADKAFIFAKRTCNKDRNCIRYGVTNCHRQSLHVVICRIFDERNTEAQGKYTCTRRVRVALDPYTYQVKVTGVAAWQC